MLSRSSRVQCSRSLTVKIPFSSRQFVVRTERPISAVLISKRDCMVLARLSDTLNGMRVITRGPSLDREVIVLATMARQSACRTGVKYNTRIGSEYRLDRANFRQ